MERRDCYSILGVSPHASEQEVDEAFRKLSLRYDPNNVVTGDIDKFQELKTAYRVFNDLKIMSG